MRASKWTTNPAAPAQPVRFTIVHTPKLVQVTLIKEQASGQCLRLRICLNPKEGAELAYSILSPNRKSSEDDSLFKEEE